MAKQLSPEHRAKIAAALKGRKPANFEAMLAKSHSTPRPSGPKSTSWKGDSVGYFRLHVWVQEQLGKPSICTECGTTTAKRYEWANISLEYKRDLTDWRRLCVSCHRKEGFARKEYTTVLKGTHRQTNTGRTHFKPGVVANPARSYLENRNCQHCGVVFHPRLARLSFCSRPCYWAWMRGKPKNSSS